MNETGAEQQPEPMSGEEQRIDPMVQLALERIRSEQNLVGGLVAGLAAAMLGAVVWALVTVFTGMQIGWMAVAVGFLVAIAVRTVGRGVDQSFAIIGAALALLGCLLGNLFTVCHFLAEAEGVGYFEVLTSLNLAGIVELLKFSFNPMDLLFYGVAVYEGYKLSRRQISPGELEAAATGSAAALGPDA
jgi:hypothetical protein